MLAEIIEGLDTSLDSHVDLPDMLRGLALSGYADIDIGVSETRYFCISDINRHVSHDPFLIAEFDSLCNAGRQLS